MSRALANAASALGTGILQMGISNQREKMENERTANMERLRLENREYQEGITASNREYQEGVKSSDRIFTAEQNELNRKSREKTAGSKGNGGFNSKDKLAYTEYKNLRKQIYAAHDQRKDIRDDQDTVYDSETGKSDAIKGVNSHIDMLRKQMVFVQKNNPFLTDIFGTVKVEDKVVDVMPTKPPPPSLEGLATPDAMKIKTDDPVITENKDPKPILSVGSKENAMDDMAAYKSKLKEWNERNPDAKSIRQAKMKASKEKYKAEKEKSRLEDEASKLEKAKPIAAEIKALFNSGKLAKMSFKARSEYVVRLSGNMKKLLPKEIADLLIKY